MKNDKQSSSVEWLAKSYLDLLTKLNNDEISLKEFEIKYIEILEQAQEMHKEEHRKTYNQGLMSNFQDFYGYYIETFGGNNERQETK